MIEFNEFETVIYWTRIGMCVTWLWGVLMDLEFYKKFDDYSDIELANYYVDLLVYNRDYELSILEIIILNRFLMKYYEGNDEV